MILTGFLADTKINPTVEPGLFYGGTKTVYKNLIGALFAALYAAVMSYVLWKFLDLVMDIHVSAEDAKLGLDFSVHGEVRSSKGLGG